jgi:hypothetical protein
LRAANDRLTRVAPGHASSEAERRVIPVEQLAALTSRKRRLHAVHRGETMAAMTTSPRLVLGLVVSLAVISCGSDERVGHLADAPPMPDAAEVDAPPPIDAAVFDIDGCRVDGQEACGNGIDDNCNGMVDEGCPCTPGAIQTCFAGKPVQRHVGACTDGQQVCVGNPAAWGQCDNGIGPTVEKCDGLDNNCNGMVDEQLTCTVGLTCPAPGTLPEGHAFDAYVIDGTRFFAGAVQSWTWGVSGGPCERLFASEGKPTSFTLTAADTATPTFTPSEAGDYTVHVAIMTAAGELLECTFIVHVAGKGLRIELCWDRSGETDVDLHVHIPHATTDWFDSNDDCYYINCAGRSATHVDWQYAQSPLVECVNGPEGDAWTVLGTCNNPRLDIDNISVPGRPEDTNIDQPENGATYRVMANYFSGTGATHPIANIYCQGHLVASFGQAPDTVPGFDLAGQDISGSMWRIADITAHVDGAGVTTCDVAALHPADQTTGYDVRNGVHTY